jgi:hypothetical protein
MTDTPRTPVTPELVTAMAAAAGSPIPDDHLEEATVLLSALYTLDARLGQLDLDGIEPEFRWDARWEQTGSEPA